MSWEDMDLENENGGRFANLYAFNKTTVGGTTLYHKRVHKAKWVSSDHTTMDQINYICVNKKSRTMEDATTERRADVFRSPPGGCQDETEGKEALDNCGDSITKV
ncbi:unnamed protein product [Schistosoma curassoni]|uniref:Retrotransposon protein n=1 Tax=Schistosoma curassoni TaxID=6186 RepID=A0A183KRR5_9TREM|nr:unnamed protein product [Schistosoma curassoni]